MRLFTALEIPPDIVARLERLLSSLRPEALINWSPLENLHITTKFIGEWPEKRLDQLDKALAALRSRVAFSVEIKDLGWFPNANSPKVLWAGIHGGDELNQLAAATEECLVELGVPREDRPYTSHLTLARIKSAVPLQKLRVKVQELQPAKIGDFVASGFHLFQSEPGSKASLYRKIRDYRFAGQTT
jgi:2'-5' RNA ligase